MTISQLERSTGLYPYKGQILTRTKIITQDLKAGFFTEIASGSSEGQMKLRLDTRGVTEERLYVRCRSNTYYE